MKSSFNRLLTAAVAAAHTNSQSQMEKGESNAHAHTHTVQRPCVWFILLGLIEVQQQTHARACTQSERIEAIDDTFQLGQNTTKRLKPFAFAI